MTTPNPTHVLFLDLETTGSDPYDPYAAVLEVGAIVCEWEPGLRQVGQASLLIRPPGNTQDHTTMWQSMLPVVRDMHTANGLWAEATTSDQAWDVARADHALTGWLRGLVGDAQVPICGAGVGQLDVPFVKVHLPQLATRVTYWPIDFSNVRRAFQLGGRVDLVDLAGDVDAKPHRGLGDAELHVAEARRYLQLIRSLPGAPGSVEDSRVVLPGSGVTIRPAMGVTLPVEGTPI